jgi:hypothetical protein
MTYFRVLPNNLPGVTEGSHESSVWIVCAMVKIQTGHFLNANHVVTP